MARLLALDLPAGHAVVDAVRRAWDDGDAVMVVDRRLPGPAREALLANARPHLHLGEGDAEPVPFDVGAPPLDDGDALVAATSGSTGVPKLLVHTRAGLTAHAAAVHTRLGVDVDRDRWLACLPLDHLGGFGVVARSLLTGTGVDVLGAFDAGAVSAAPASLGSTLVSLVPTALDRVRSDGFRWVVLGGAPDRVERPANVVRTYGMTETGGGVVYDGVPLPGTEVRVGADGTVALRGPTMARGRRSPDGTVEPIVDGDGWLTTGDLGRWDADGRLVIEGRADDLIITGGENVWPAPVEAALRTHPSVADVVVHGEPDDTWGQRVVAVVVPADPAMPPTLDDLRGHLDGRVAPAARPRALTLTDALERSSLGKVVRPRDRALDREQPTDQ